MNYKSQYLHITYQFVLYVPDINNNGHDTSPQFAGQHMDFIMKRFFDTPAFTEDGLRTLFVVTWDENAVTSKEWWTIRPNDKNRVLTVLWTPSYTTGLLRGCRQTEDNFHYTHYSLLSTIQANWGLGDLGLNDRLANPFTLNCVDELD